MSQIQVRLQKGFMTAELLPLRDGEIPTCNGCEKPIRFVKTQRGKIMPISRQTDGSFISHFADCEKAYLFRNKNKNADSYKAVQ